MTAALDSTTDPDDTPGTAGPFGAAAPDLFNKSWQPLPVVGKAGNLPKGVTGRDGRLIESGDIGQWIVDGRFGDSVAIRAVTRNGQLLVGLDVDHYDDKRGGDTIAELEQQLGPLPPTWVTSARPAPSGIRWYRLPRPIELITNLPGIEIIQRHHRYGVAPPSIHPDLNTEYRWRRPDGTKAHEAPNVHELPELPAAWIEHLTDTRPKAPERQAAHWPEQRANEADWHHLVAERYRTGLEIIAGPAGGRHDDIGKVVGALTRDESRGRSGATSAMEQLSDRWDSFIGAEDRRRTGEVLGMIEWSRREVARTKSTAEVEMAEVQRILVDPIVAAGGSIGTVPASHRPPADKPPATGRFVTGGAIFDQPEGTPAVWGRDQEVIWAEGEALLIVSPTGAGKTTITGQLVGGLVGIDDYATVLGWPVKAHRKVLYLAMDRPRQIMRSLRRHFTADHRAILDERLVIWKGPPPEDLALHPERLTIMAKEAGAEVVVLDSLKDAAIGLVDDTVGSGLNNAIQRALAEGIEVLSNHHQRKGTQGQKPKTLEDVYGSTWLTAGAGSVVLLWGQAGDPIVELIHLKQPADIVGPLKIEHDHQAGRSTVSRGFDTNRFLCLRGAAGATSTDVAKAWFEKPKPTNVERTKARRKLDRLVDSGLATVAEASTVGGPGGGQGAVYVAIGTVLVPQ